MGTGPGDLDGSTLEIGCGYHVRPFPKSGLHYRREGSDSRTWDPRGIRVAKKEKRCKETDGWEQQKQNLPIKIEITYVFRASPCVPDIMLSVFQRSSR